MMTNIASILEWLGAFLAVSGSLLLAINGRYAKLGWPLFLASNVFWIGYGWIQDAYGLLFQQIFFTGTSLLGIYRWIINADCDPVVLARNSRQAELGRWLTRTFGHESAISVAERSRRFVEEAIELAQASGLSEKDVADLVRYVYARPVGDPEQEVGGVAVTFLAYCGAAGFSADELEKRELSRIYAKDVAYFRERHNAKALAGIALRVPDGMPITTGE